MGEERVGQRSSLRRERGCIRLQVAALQQGSGELLLKYCSLGAVAVADLHTLNMSHVCAHGCT